MHLKRGSMGPTEDDKQINFQDLEDINMRLINKMITKQEWCPVNMRVDRARCESHQ